jgi:D-alanyl-D-alanine carboxypeptidase
VAREQMTVNLTDAERTNAQVKVDWKGPLVAPVVKDQAVGTARLIVGDTEIARVPVYPKQDVAARDGVLSRSLDTLGFWLLGG